VAKVAERVAERVAFRLSDRSPFVAVKSLARRVSTVASEIVADVHIYLLYAAPLS
jgi:hypothetical protein